MLVGAIGVAAVGAALSNALPESVPGAAAEARTAMLEDAIHLEAWEQTGAISFVFAGHHRHLWDRKRGLHRLERGSTVVMYDLKTRTGKAWRADVPLEGSELRTAIDRAWMIWCNDTFWLNPLAKLRDPGVERGAVELPDGRSGLLVHYAQGGMTPGDRYLWILGEDGLPTAWRMWVSVVPIPGLEGSWEGWTTLSTGAVISTRHAFGPVDLWFSEVAGAQTLSKLVGDVDPFSPILHEG